MNVSDLTVIEVDELPHHPTTPPPHHRGIRYIEQAGRGARDAGNWRLLRLVLPLALTLAAAAAMAGVTCAAVRRVEGRERETAIRERRARAKARRAHDMLARWVGLHFYRGGGGGARGGARPASGSAADDEDDDDDGGGDDDDDDYDAIDAVSQRHALACR